MLDSFVQFFERANIDDLNNKLLHSSSWKQHGRKSYGHHQINQVLGDWLSLVGRSKVSLLSEINQGFISHYTLKMEPFKTDCSFVMDLQVKHNDNHIKWVNCLVDTGRLAVCKATDLSTFTDQFCRPDPLHIPDLDQQNHLQNEHAIPSMMISDKSINTKLLDNWWSIWSIGNLDRIESIYTDKVELYYPCLGHIENKEQWFDETAYLRSVLNRKLCQLESLAIQNNHVAIRWYIDGDHKASKHRVRLNCSSILTIDGERISSDIFLFDYVAQMKQFPYCELILTRGSLR